jgi:hypothetical protein
MMREGILEMYRWDLYRLLRYTRFRPKYLKTSKHKKTFKSKLGKPSKMTNRQHVPRNVPFPYEEIYEIRVLLIYSSAMFALETADSFITSLLTPWRI